MWHIGPICVVTCNTCIKYIERERKTISQKHGLLKLEATSIGKSLTQDSETSFLTGCSPAPAQTRSPGLDSTVLFKQKCKTYLSDCSPQYYTPCTSQMPRCKFCLYYIVAPTIDILPSECKPAILTGLRDHLGYQLYFHTWPSFSVAKLPLSQQLSLLVDKDSTDLPKTDVCLDQN